MEKTTLESDIRLTLRLPDYLHAAINTEAKKQERSINNQIVFALKQAYPNAQKDFSSSSKPALTENGGG